MNDVKISGIIKDIELSHEINGNSFYKFYICSDRLSGTPDVLPCIVSEKLIEEIKNHEKIVIYGKLRTRNAEIDGKSRLLVYIMVHCVSEYVGRDENIVLISGFVTKKANLRNTPLGRTIADTILAHDRENNSDSDYIPCIAWSGNATRLEQMEVGTKLHVAGRLQSRQYKKVYPDGNEEIKTAYELSINRMTEGAKR